MHLKVHPGEAFCVFVSHIYIYTLHIHNCLPHMWCLHIWSCVAHIIWVLMWRNATGNDIWSCVCSGGQALKNRFSSLHHPFHPPKHPHLVPVAAHPCHPSQYPQELSPRLHQSSSFHTPSSILNSVPVCCSQTGALFQSP